MGTPFTLRRATINDADDLAALAAITFPLACPPSVTREDIADFLAEVLSANNFRTYTTENVIFVAQSEAGLIGYVLLKAGVGSDEGVWAAITTLPAMEISKMYVHPDHHGLGVAAALMTTAVDYARHEGNASLWLGVNNENLRAQRFYAKSGFERAGDKKFLVGGKTHYDYVLRRPLG